MSYIFYIFKSILLYLLLIPGVSHAKSSSSKNQHQPLIVLLHGLGNHASSFKSMKQKLEQSCPDAFVFTPKSVEGMKSIELSISKQAEMIFQEICSKVANLKDRAILLVGHSQGALTGYAFLKQYEDTLKNIKGLVTLAAPWEGAAGARVDAAMLAQNLTASVLKDLRTLSFNLGYAKNELEKQLMLNVQSNQVVCSRPGGKDLMPGSAFLAEVRKSLHKEKVPILAIGAGQNNFRALLTKKKARRFKLKALNDIYTFFVVGEKRINGRHDMQVSVDSQHALHIVPKKKKNFTRLLIKDAFHSSYVLTVPVPKDKAILCHPTALGAVVNFAKTIFK